MSDCTYKPIRQLLKTRLYFNLFWFALSYCYTHNTIQPHRRLCWYIIFPHSLCDTTVQANVSQSEQLYNTSPENPFPRLEIKPLLSGLSVRHLNRTIWLHTFELGRSDQLVFDADLEKPVKRVAANVGLDGSQNLFLVSIFGSNLILHFIIACFSAVTETVFLYLLLCKSLLRIWNLF